jgi:hypothetical protein
MIKWNEVVIDVTFSGTYAVCLDEARLWDGNGAYVQSKYRIINVRFTQWGARRLAKRTAKKFGISVIREGELTFKTEGDRYLRALMAKLEVETNRRKR